MQCPVKWGHMLVIRIPWNQMSQIWMKFSGNIRFECHSEFTWTQVMWIVWLPVKNLANMNTFSVISRSFFMQDRQILHNNRVHTLWLCSSHVYCSHRGRLLSCSINKCLYLHGSHNVIYTYSRSQQHNPYYFWQTESSFLEAVTDHYYLLGDERMTSVFVAFGPSVPVACRSSNHAFSRKWSGMEKKLWSIFTHFREFLSNIYRTQKKTSGFSIFKTDDKIWLVALDNSFAFSGFWRVKKNKTKNHIMHVLRWNASIIAERPMNWRWYHVLVTLKYFTDERNWLDHNACMAYM